MAAEAINEVPTASQTSSSTASDSQRSGFETSSRVREQGFDPRARALRRVAEYLRALGLTDGARIDTLCEEIAAEVGLALPVSAASDGLLSAAQAPKTAASDTRSAHKSSQDEVRAAVAQAQARYERFLQAVFGAEAETLDALWLRAFIGSCPQVFLGDADAARAAAERFGDPRAGRPPAHAHFRDQSLRRARLPSWLLGAIPPGLLTVAGTCVLVATLARDGLSLIELLWAGLFAFLTALGAAGMSVAVSGFIQSLRLRSPRAAEHALAESSSAPLPRSALIMPIYEEDAEHVFAAIAAMREALASTPGGEAFEIFVLSDSRRPEQAAEEERAFRRIASVGEPGVPVYYRRRSRNDRQKAGNLAEFFERWGHRYTYAVVLDADSLMRADTLVRMLRRMEASPRVALLQAPLALHGGRTLFARAQQFAASVSGPLFMRGLSAWAGPHGNYYGHNAVLRVRAFLDCCALPVLAGEPPLGGHILSHDFVEAALLCRAGWEVRMADDLDGSWEELPPTLPEYVARDRRWCQGNLQHLRIALAEGLQPMSRLHMWIGAACYLAGPAWMAFVALAVLLTQSKGGAVLPATVAIGLCALTALLLLAPRGLGVLSTLRDQELRAAHGGAPSLVLGAVLETLLAALLAPLLMVHHTRIVLSIVLGGSVRWGAQQRRARGAARAIVHAEAFSTLLGMSSAVWLSLQAPQLLIWLAPVWLPLVLAIPLALAVSSERMGQLCSRLGLLTVPCETQPDELVARVHDLRALTTRDESARFRDLVLDPLLLSAHLARLPQPPSTASEASREALSNLRRRALRVGPAALSASERAALTSDAECMRTLHREAWQHWPVESWHLARNQNQLPPEDAP